MNKDFFFENTSSTQLSDGPSGSFDITTEGNVIWVDLRGVWDIKVDFAYLTELTQHMQKMRGNPWCIIVDMRGWIVPDNHQACNEKVDLRLDRRNQKAEVWIVEDPEQGDFLVHFMKEAGFPFAKVRSEQEAFQWLSTQGFSTEISRKIVSTQV